MTHFAATLPTLRTLSMLPLRDADVLLSFAERLYGAQSTTEARQALRRIDTYRRLLGLTLSIRSMERMAARSIQRGDIGRRGGASAVGTTRHSVVRGYTRGWLRLVG
jgi:hypothetical protein